MKRALAIALMLAACAREEAPAPKPAAPPAPKPARVVSNAPVQTDRTHYKMQEGPYGPEAVIETTFTAPADQDVYIVNCNGQHGLGLQRRNGEQWETAWVISMNACMSMPIIVRAGQKYSGTIVAASGADAAVSSRATERDVPSGTYRVVWHGLVTPFDISKGPIGADLPIEQRVSDPIFIEAAPPLDPSQPSPAVPPAEITAVEPAHGAAADRNAPIRVTIGPVFGDPHLYVDREFVEYVRRGNVMEYAPPRGWSPGRHAIRIVYQSEAKKTLWYAWSFTVPPRPQ